MDLLDIPDLPLEQILFYLDLRSLAALGCSCTDWSEYLNNNERVWRKYCVRLGYEQPEEVEDKTWDTWKEFAFLIVKRHNQVRNSRCFLHRRFTIRDENVPLFHPPLTINAIYYYGKRLAVATRNGLQIWNTFPVMELNVRISTSLSNYSVKMDDSNVLVAYDNGDMESYSLVLTSTAIYRQPEWRQGPVMSYDFDSESNIVVASFATGPIRIWRLSTGTHVKTIGDVSSDMSGLIKIVWMERPLRDKGLLYLFLKQLDKLLMWRGTYDENSNGVIDWSPNPDVIHTEQPDMTLDYRVNILNHASNFLYYTLPSDAEHPPEIQEWDLNLRAETRKIRTPSKIRRLIAVGKKYIAYLSEEGRRIIVLEISSGKVLTTFEVPPNIHDQALYIERWAVVFCRQDWLDGINLATDKGNILAYIESDRIVHYVDWITRHAFP